MANKWLGAVTFQQIFDLTREPRLSPASSDTFLGIVFVHGDWQSFPSANERLSYWAEHALADINAKTFAANISVGGTKADDLEFCLQQCAIPPGHLPCLAVVFQSPTMSQSRMKFLGEIQTYDIIKSVMVDDTILARKISRSLSDQVDSIIDEYDVSIRPSSALRLFVAGDRSSVGKSSICLGLLATAIRTLGYTPESIAYIKPATQSESTQLITLFCEKYGVHCLPVGPLVYYRGFTRAFLEGATAPTTDLLATCAHAVDRVARGKRLVLVDGVGFPAVGSICGTSNAAVAQACGVNGILLVGGSGVGGAVDAYNLNAQYFATTAIRVLGAVFNKLKTTGYYSLEDCRKQVTSYFDQYRPQQQAFGFVPQFDGTLSMETVEAFLESFASHVDVRAILGALAEEQQNEEMDSSSPNSVVARTRRDNIQQESPKRRKLQHGGLRSREEIEGAAITAGAAPSA